MVNVTPNKSSSASIGFTLIELLVTMTIIAILLTLAAPRYLGNVERAKEAVLRSNLETTRDAIQKFYVDTGRYPEQLQTLVDQHYIRKLPYDPILERSDRWISIEKEPTDESGIHDLRSAAPGLGLNGKPYRDW